MRISPIKSFFLLQNQFVHARRDFNHILQYYVQDRRCERFALLVKISHGLLFKQVFLHTGIINDTFQFQQYDHSCKNKCLAWKKVYYFARVQ